MKSLKKVKPVVSVKNTKPVVKAVATKVTTKKASFDYSAALKKHGIKEQKKLLSEIIRILGNLKKSL